MAKRQFSYRYPIIEKARYDTGLIKTYEIDRLTFNWNDWVLSEISFRKGNPVHWCLASAFKLDPQTNTGTVWIASPNWEETFHFYPIENLNWFKPIRVIEDVRRAPDSNANPDLWM